MHSALQSQTQTSTSTSDGQSFRTFSIAQLAEQKGKAISRLPYSIRVLVENLLRNIDGFSVKDEDVLNALSWDPNAESRPDIPFKPARVVMQDFTGVPAVVDLAAMRDAISKAGGDPSKINPLVETALVIDHSVQVDHFGSAEALKKNVAIEYERNTERYQLLKWAQTAFDNFKVVPPGMGIIHQVNLEFLAQGLVTREKDGVTEAFPDTCVGTDSHTTMINGLGVLGWGVGGIEAEAVMLGQPYYMVLPDVVGVKLTGSIREGVTPTDVVLRITQVLREHGVVGKFVEFFGDALNGLTLPDRATIANMAPEYGATCGFFPVDAETVRYLKDSNRGASAVQTEAVMKALSLFREDPAEQPDYTAVVEVDLSSVDSTLAGPKRPQDRVPMRKLKADFKETLHNEKGMRGFGIDTADATTEVGVEGMDETLTHGSLMIAAITSCTNTSNPYVMLGAGLLAKNAVEKGLCVKPYVRTSLAPGSQVVTEYLEQAGVLSYLEQLRFNVVGYGCTTCIGNSGSLDIPLIKAIKKGNLIAASVLSGNRNFEGRVNPYVQANYLASPLHVVAYALAGTVDFDPESDPIGHDNDGQPVMLKDIWPSNADIEALVKANLSEQMYAERYATVFDGTEDWQELAAPTSGTYAWERSSTYIQCPPFFEDFTDTKGPEDIIDAHVLAMLGDSVTTDHISPAGAIPEEYPAGRFLAERGVETKSFNSYGSRRGNHNIMMRGTFANVRMRNLLADGQEGGWTRFHPTGEIVAIYDAAEAYQKSDTPLVVIGGKEYGTGSSRDWAAKGTRLLGVRAVITESYERIHRSNLVGMGVLPLQFAQGANAESLGLDGSEVFTLRGLSDLKAKQYIDVEARNAEGEVKRFSALVRLDTDVEVLYYNNGGILQTVLKRLAEESAE